MNKLKHLLLLLAALLAACADDLTTSQPPLPTDPLAGYDGPLAVSITLAGSSTTTRTETNLTGTTVTDAYFGEHPFPKTKFSAKDSIGILHIASKEEEGDYQVLQYKAVTTDGGATWSIQDMEGHTATLRHFAAHENYYYAYAPFRKDGLDKEADFDLDVLPTCAVPTYDEFGEQTGTANQPTPAYKLFEKMIDATLYEGGTVSDATRRSQNTEEAFSACDLLAARGECSVDKGSGTATLTLQMDHLMALDILMLKKWDGKVTVYGCYDTWVAPNGKIWRMKQRLEPVKKVVMDGSQWPRTEAVAKDEIQKKDANDNDIPGQYVPAFEGLGKWLLGLDTDTCKFYMQLVKPYDGRERYGYQNRAVDGGWVIDIPPVPAGQYCVVGTPYFRYFRNEGFLPAKDDDNEAGESWHNESQWKMYYKNMSYTWTYEEILFPRSNIRYDYDYVLEVGDLLTSGGNIIKGPDAVYDGPKSPEAGETAVGRVMWIAWGCKEYIDDDRTMYDTPARSGDELNHGFWNADGTLYGWLPVSSSSGNTWMSNMRGKGYDVSSASGGYVMNIQYFPDLYWGVWGAGSKWSCQADGLYDDNGYRAKGREQTDYGRAHFVVDHTAYDGLTSLDAYWDHEVCNHFLVFAFDDVEVPSAVTNDCGIFQSPMPEEPCAFWHDGFSGWNSCMAADIFLSDKTYDNTGSMLRSTVSAADWGGSDDLPWMVPTIPQYEVALNDALEFYYEYPDNPIGLSMADGVEPTAFFDNALLSSSRLKSSGEGLVLTCSTTKLDESYPLYMGTWGGKAHFYEYYLNYKSTQSYFHHVPIRQTDNKLPIWHNTLYKSNGIYFAGLWDGTKGTEAQIKDVMNTEHKADPPRRFRPCIAY